MAEKYRIVLKTTEDIKANLLYFNCYIYFCEQALSFDNFLSNVDSFVILGDIRK